MNCYTHIYILLSKVSDRVYIGSTNTPKARLCNHQGKGTLSYGVKDAKNLMMEIVDVVPESNRAKWEQHYISLFTKWGLNVINTKSAEDGGNSFIKTRKTKTFTKDEFIWIHSLKEKKDHLFIATKHKVKANEVANAMFTRKMTMKVYNAIMAYYTEKELKQVA